MVHTYWQIGKRIVAAEGPGAKATKANVNLSTADLALDHYVAVTTAG